MAMWWYLILVLPRLASSQAANKEPRPTCHVSHTIKYILLHAGLGPCELGHHRCPPEVINDVLVNQIRPCVFEEKCLKTPEDEGDMRTNGECERAWQYALKEFRDWETHCAGKTLEECRWRQWKLFHDLEHITDHVDLYSQGRD